MCVVRCVGCVYICVVDIAMIFDDWLIEKEYSSANSTIFVDSGFY